MYKFLHSVYLDEEKCKGCITCLRRCPTQAIRVRSGKAQIISEFCIGCGECVKHCPHHAKRVRRNGLEVINNYKYTVALPPPSLYSQFNNLTDVNVLLTALIRMGFDDVFEVSAGAEVVSVETRKYIDAHPDKWPVISSACPAVVRLIRVKFPNLIDHLLPILPPVEVAAKMARQRAMEKTGLSAEDIGIIFISPCPAKITFVQSPLGLKKSNVDEAIAVKDIYSSIIPYMESEGSLEHLSESGKIGIGWGITGGEAAGLFTDNYLEADGIENVIHVLEDLEDEKFPKNLRFIELDSCSGGCVGGVLNVENPYIARSKVKQIKQYIPLSPTTAFERCNIASEELVWTDPVKYEPVFQLGKDMLESMTNLSAVEELLERLPGLNCGSCGAPNCRAHAEDVVKGKNNASIDDCIYLSGDDDLLKNSQLINNDI